jgi:hypothetical protein
MHSKLDGCIDSYWGGWVGGTVFSTIFFCLMYLANLDEVKGHKRRKDDFKDRG